MEDAIYMINRLDDFCPNCKRNYALEMYDGYGNKLHYFKLLNSNTLTSIDLKRNIVLKCRYCNTEVRIDRMDQDRFIPLIPEAVKDNSYNKFFDDIQYRKNKLYNLYKVNERMNENENNRI